jgi:TonB family protein
MNARLCTLGAVLLAAVALIPRLSAQDVTIGEPGWFETDGAPDGPPQLRRSPHVDYPDVLLTSDESSYVILARYLDAEGQGLMMETHGAHPWFTRAVEEAVGGWQMTPATRGGQAVPSWSWIPIIFNPGSASPKRPDAKPRLLAVTPVIVPPATMIKLRGDTSAWGTVSLDAAGVPQKIKLEPPASAKLLPSVEAALKHWRFAPARHGGEPVAADFRVAFHFFPPMAPIPAKTTFPQAVKRVPPIYPYGLQRNDIIGEVLVGFVIDSKGNVVNAVALRSNSPGFNQPAVDAVLKWKFKPATVDGRPVSTRMEVPIVFNFSDDSGREQMTVTSPDRRAQEKMPEEIRYDMAPKLRGAVLPVYPYALMREGITGKAKVFFQLDLEGRVVGVKIAEATHPEFGLALAAAVERYKFYPALKQGKPTPTMLKAEQEFSPSILMAVEDRELLRREKKKPGSIVGAAKLDSPLQWLLSEPPVFPLALRGSGERGEAQIELLIDEAGHARLPRVVEASNPAFGYAAVQAVSQWLFSPPKADGKSVVTRVIVPFVFEAKPVVLGTAVGEPPPPAPNAAEKSQEHGP